MLTIKMDILKLRRGPTDGLDETTLTAKKEYSNNFTESNNNFVQAFTIMGKIVTFLSMVLNFVHFKGKYSEIKATLFTT